MKPLVDWSDRMAKWNPFGAAPPVDPKNPEGPTGPSVLDRLRSLLNPPAPAPTEPLLHDRPPVVPPIPIPPTPVPPAPPFVLPNLGGMDQFKSPSQNGVPPMPRPAFAPIAFRPTDGLENPLLDKGASGSSSGTSGAIAIIAAGVRKGGFDALSDFFQSMKNLNKSGGVMPASYETGAGGSGGGAGGLPSGSGGGGRPDDGAGAGGHPGAPGTPAGRIGHAVRRQREGSGGVNPGGVPDSGSPAQPPGPPGTYRPQYALGAHDLSPAVLGTIAGEASTRNPAALDAVINNMMNRVGAKGYGPSGNLEEVARSQGVSGRQPQYTGFRTPSAAEAKIISDRIKAIASGGEPDTTHGSMEYRGAGLYQNFKARHPEGVGIGGNWFFPTIKPGLTQPLLSRTRWPARCPRGRSRQHRRSSTFPRCPDRTFPPMATCLRRLQSMAPSCERCSASAVRRKRR